MTLSAAIAGATGIATESASAMNEERRESMTDPRYASVDISRLCHRRRGLSCPQEILPGAPTAAASVGISHEVALADLDAVVAQDSVRGRQVEIEVRQGRIEEIVEAGQFALASCQVERQL